MYLDVRVKERSAGNALAEAARWRKSEGTWCYWSTLDSIGAATGARTAADGMWSILWWLWAIAENVVRRD
jgi:hypothetical protein